MTTTARSVADTVPSRPPEHNAFTSDPSLRYWVKRLAPRHADSELLTMVGAHVGGHRLQDAADRANRLTPALRSHDRGGRRVDDIAFDESWHTLLDTVTDSGICGLPWLVPTGGYALRGAAFELYGRLDMGVMCPVSMTTAAVPVLQRSDDSGELAAQWLPQLVEGRPRQALAGMAMTEPQGGSDLSGTSTVAIGRSDGTFRLDGHKWFCSHPVADVLLVLAREADTDDVSCFVVPGWLEDGSRNGIELLRLKDKLGTRSLASAEVQLRNASGARIGERGAGVRTIIDMVTHTRMDCALGSTGVMTRALSEVVHYARERSAFGKQLIEQPLMRAVIADMALEREGALAMAMDVCRAFDEGDSLGRLTTALAKYWITRRAVSLCIEAVECLGGNGYTEEWPLARLYRDSQVNSTWEGSGNVIVLDVFRALQRDPTLQQQFTQRVRDLIDPADIADDDRQRINELLLATPASVEAGRAIVADWSIAMQMALLYSRAAHTGDAADGIVAHSFAQTRPPLATFGSKDAGSLQDAADVLIPRHTMY